MKLVARGGYRFESCHDHQEGAASRQLRKIEHYEQIQSNSGLP